MDTASATRSKLPGFPPVETTRRESGRLGPPEHEPDVSSATNMPLFTASPTCVRNPGQTDRKLVIFKIFSEIPPL